MSTLRRTTTLTALLLGATLLAPSGSATAAGETCRGEAATIVGTGTAIQGTEGRDVIVTGTTNIVWASGGDDLICITATPGGSGLTFDAGPGNDVVDATASRANQISVVLGAGADEFHGSATDDFVSSGGLAAADNDRDVISSGDGVDVISSMSNTVPNPDVITAGPGDDHLYIDGPLAADGRLDGGEGNDGLNTKVQFGSLAVDAANGIARLDGADWMRWLGFEDLGLKLGRVDLVYSGGEQDESLRISSIGGIPSLDVRLNGGDDELDLVFAAAFGPSRLDGGSGRDGIEVRGEGAVRADLERDTLERDGEQHKLIAMEGVTAYAKSVRLIGDDGPNVLEGGPCGMRATGGRGRDHLHSVPLPQDVGSMRCTRTTTVLDGGAQNDQLEGSRSADMLRGGPGHDRIFGRQGRDTAIGGPGIDGCRSSEIRKSCEK